MPLHFVGALMTLDERYGFSSRCYRLFILRHHRHNSVMVPVYSTSIGTPRYIGVYMWGYL